MAHGVVHWEIGGRDLEKLEAFYHDLFGWDYSGYDENYKLVASVEEGIGGGLMRCTNEMPPYVSFYVAVDDLEITLEQAEKLGGETLVPPTPIPQMGSFAMFRDPEGNVIGILQPAMERAATPAPPMSATAG